MEFFEKLIGHFYIALIAQDRYLLILEGLKNTLIMTVCAVVIGIAIGVLIAVIKYFAEGNRKLWILDKICLIYTSVIRGTPVMVQLLILATVVLVGVREMIIVAIIGFGINSGAYVSEVIRSGINAVDKGQEEAGRSLGLNRVETMRLIIMPQAIKNILPALGNEFIVLLKETSIAGYIAVHDLTKSGEIIKNNTYDGTSLFIVAGIYLVLVIVIAKILRNFERRLRKSDRN